MFKELDNIKAINNISKNVIKGCEGTIVFVPNCMPIEYIVEFFNEEGDTLDLLCVQPNDIEIDLS
jgi:hypothetical protein